MNAETMYQIAKVRHDEDLRAAEAFRLAKQAQGDQLLRTHKLLNQVVSFAKQVGARSLEPAQTAEVPPIELSREQPKHSEYEIRRLL